MRLLIVEDEQGMAEGLQGLLEKQGYATDLAFDGDSGLDNGLTGLYDLIILDIMLPGRDGLSVLKELRRDGVETPVLMLTARSSVADRIQGLDHGADDYLTKPFDTGEFLARVRALTRRNGVPLEEEPSFGDIRLDRRKLELCRGNERLRLGPKEFQVMECLLLNKNQIIPRALLCEKVWGLLSEAEYNNVEVYISFLRKKLRALHSNVQILSIRNAGYHLEVQP
ncbi:response regulator transcription factor [Dysosmobacter sp. Sow4_B12]|uniref:response regulator transcription factor n=1 Tax=Dysosmobacter sp. Sow4_B12 TaxID=3438777 RepID=UPI003F8DC586